MTKLSAFIFLIAGPLWAADLTKSSVPDLIREAEKLVDQYEDPRHLDKLEATLRELEKRDSKLPYLHWARARLAFWRKENFYVHETSSNRKEMEEGKLALGERCHDHADQCLELAPKNAECHLMKGVCYSMQGSTWGASLKSIRILRPMDRELRFAMDTPSDFEHTGGLTTRQLAQVMRGILYRLMPESIWFRIFVGIRGNLEEAYDWIKSGVTGRLRKEPLGLLELGVTAICLGQKRDKPEKVAEGIAVLREGLLLPVRYALDERDRSNMRYLLNHTDEACSYRRERFEHVNEQVLKAETERSTSIVPGPGEP